MRPVLLAVLAASLATPAIAGEPETQRDAEQLADKLNDPVTQAVVSSAVGAMVSAVLDVRVDGMAKALETMNGGRPSDLRGKTVRDLATRDNPDFERKVQSDTRQAVGAAGGMASAVAVMLPELQEAARKMKDALPDMH